MRSLHSVGTLLLRGAGAIRRWPWRTVGRVVWAVVLAALFVVAVPGVRPNPDDYAFKTIGYASGYLFDFVQWEGQVLLDKAANAAVSPQRHMPEPDRVQFVRDYLQLVQEIHALEAQIRDIYADPHIPDHASESAPLRAERDGLRAVQRERQALAEAIIEAQVSEMLVEYGFGLGGQAIPPVTIRFTALPTILIVSPRDRIERVGAYSLQHGLTVDQMETIESAVDADLDVSSLIVPIGGLAVWPAMLIETGHLSAAFDVAAHEWAHHYLIFFPLGFNYGVSPDLITINETVANIIGREIGWAVLDRHYPDLAPPPPDYTPLPPPEDVSPAEETPDDFDFRAEMRATRVRVDDLLAASRVEEAERYMEERRAVFFEQGYRIRKINQAYFAFYGSYADEPGATGADPIGPALRDLRFNSASLAEFVRMVRGMTSLAEIEQALEARRAQREAGG